MKNLEGTIQQLSTRPSSEIIDWIITNVNVQDIVNALRGIDSRSATTLNNQIVATENANAANEPYDQVHGTNPTSQGEGLQGSRGSRGSRGSGRSGGSFSGYTGAALTTGQTSVVPSGNNSLMVFARDSTYVPKDPTVATSVTYPGPSTANIPRFIDIVDPDTTGKTFSSEEKKIEYGLNMTLKKWQKWLAKYKKATPEQEDRMKGEIANMTGFYSDLVAGYMEGKNMGDQAFIPFMVFPFPLENKIYDKHSTGMPKQVDVEKTLAAEIQLKSHFLGAVGYSHFEHSYSNDEKLAKGQVGVMPPENIARNMKPISEKNRRPRGKNGERPSKHKLFNDAIAKSLESKGNYLRLVNGHTFGTIASLHYAEKAKMLSLYEAAFLGRNSQERDRAADEMLEYMNTVNNTLVNIIRKENKGGVSLSRVYSFIVNGVYYENFSADDLRLDLAKAYNYAEPGSSRFGRVFGSSSRPSFGMNRAVSRTSGFGMVPHVPRRPSFGMNKAISRTAFGGVPQGVPKRWDMDHAQRSAAKINVYLVGARGAGRYVGVEYTDAAGWSGLKEFDVPRLESRRARWSSGPVDRAQFRDLPDLVAPRDLVEFFEPLSPENFAAYTFERSSFGRSTLSLSRFGRR